MKIRQATIADAEYIANIHASSWQEGYKGRLSNEYLSQTVPRERQAYWHKRLQLPESNQSILVAETDNQIIGFACVFTDRNSEWGSYLDNLHVDKLYQSQGVGKALLKAVSEWCSLHASSKGLCLQVTKFNTKAQYFYKQLGARNQEESTWTAPDGTIIQTYWFIWDSVEALEKS